MAIYIASSKKKEKKKKPGSRIPATLNFAHVRKKKMQKKKGQKGKKSLGAEGGKKKGEEEMRRKERKMCSACDGYFVLRACDLPPVLSRCVDRKHKVRR